MTAEAEVRKRETDTDGEKGVWGRCYSASSEDVKRVYMSGTQVTSRTWKSHKNRFCPKVSRTILLTTLNLA